MILLISQVFRNYVLIIAPARQEEINI